MNIFFRTITSAYRPWRLEFIILHLAIIVGTALILLFNLDLQSAAFFFKPNPGSEPWPFMQTGPVLFLYRYGEWPALGIAMSALIVLLVGMFNIGWRKHRRPALFLLVVFLCGPGLLVNSVFKGYWSRPRPIQVVEFGGKYDFIPILVKGIPGQGKSFPSGHVSAAFFLAAGYCIWRTTRRRLALGILAAGFLFSVLVGVSRMARGGHFLSDTLWAVYFTGLTALLITPILKYDAPEEKPDQPFRR